MLSTQIDHRQPLHQPHHGRRHPLFLLHFICTFRLFFNISTTRYFDFHLTTLRWQFRLIPPPSTAFSHHPSSFSSSSVAASSTLVLRFSTFSLFNWLLVAFVVTCRLGLLDRGSSSTATASNLTRIAVSSPILIVSSSWRSTRVLGGRSVELRIDAVFTEWRSTGVLGGRPVERDRWS